jgi:hypothetical protein
MERVLRRDNRVSERTVFVAKWCLASEEHAGTLFRVPSATNAPVFISAELKRDPADVKWRQSMLSSTKPPVDCGDMPRLKAAENIIE